MSSILYLWGYDWIHDICDTRSEVCQSVEIQLIKGIILATNS